MTKTTGIFGIGIVATALLVAAAPAPKGPDVGAPAPGMMNVTELPKDKLQLVKRDVLGPNKIVILAFFDTACVNCRKERPQLVALHEKYKDKGVVLYFVGVDYGQDGETKLRAFYKAEGFVHPVLIDRYQMMMKAYGVQSLPTVYLTSKDAAQIHIVRWKHTGYTEESVAQLDKAIADLLK
jgi:peroxiredoxin